MALVIRNPPTNAGDVKTEVQSLDWEDPLEKGMATHSNFLPWRIPWTEEPGELQSIKSQSQTHLKRLSVHAHIFTRLDISQWLEEKSYVFQT